MTRRGNQEGTFYKRKNGKWCGQIMIEGERFTAYGNTQNECKRKLKEKTRKKQERVKGIFLLNDILDEILEEYKPKVKITTYESYRFNLNRIKKVSEGIYLHEIDNNYIEELVCKLRAQGYSEDTIKTNVTIFLTFLNKARKRGLIKTTFSPPKIKKRKKHIPIYDIEKVKEEIENETNESVRFFFKLILNTGLRFGETFGLKWKDFDFDNCVIYVNRNVVTVKEGEIIQTPKNNKVGEYVQFPASFKEDILAYKAKDEGNEYLYFKRKDRLSPFRIRQKGGALFERLGISGGCHNLRHIHASMLVKNGVDILTIQQQLRHSSIEVTNTYLHSLEKNTRAAIKKLNF